MPRQSTTLTRNTYYHILLKGNINHQLFRHESDYNCFLELLTSKKHQFAFHLLGYCLLKDHVHIIIDSTTKSTLSSILHGLTLLYTKYYQKKYAVTGPVFSGRYQSEPFHQDKELLCRLRYIHQKPKRSLNNGTLAYRYSSYNAYTSPLAPSIIDRHITYRLFDKHDEQKASNFFIGIHHEIDETSIFDIKDNLYERVAIAKRILKEELTQYSYTFDYIQQPNTFREQLILRIYKDSGLSHQEIADLLSISRHVVGRVIRLHKPC